jgi:RNA polymerase sigma factor (sigma-70 family)
MSTTENKSDERILWLRFLKGDEQVLSLIYLQYSNLLFDYGCRFTADKNLVKDCIQEVFCTLIRTRKNLSETDNIRLYLLKSLKRRILRDMKDSGNKTILVNDQEYPFDLLLANNIDDQMNELDEEKRRLLSEAMLSLTERQKEAIYLRFNRGLEYEEISFLLNLNYQSSRALIHRAIEKLREIIHTHGKKMSQILFNLLFSPKNCFLAEKKV